MNEKEWKEIEIKLQLQYNPVHIVCDGHKVTLVLERTTVYKNHIAVYIDKKMKLSWLTEDCDIRRRFTCPRTKAVIVGKRKKELTKGLGKKDLAEFDKRNKYTYFTPYWTAFSSLKKHLIKNNKSIEKE